MRESPVLTFGPPTSDNRSALHYLGRLSQWTLLFDFFPFMIFLIIPKKPENKIVQNRILFSKDLLNKIAK
jgi:hypothetical protein